MANEESKVKEYAIIKAGGKQYKVSAGDVLRIEKIKADAGSSVDIDEVLLVANGDTINVGAPLLDGGKVSAQVMSHGRGNKINIIKFKRRKHYRRQAGHRQDYTELKITSIG